MISRYVFEWKWVAIGVWGLTSLGLSGRACAQAPPGPLPATQPTDSRPILSQQPEKPAVQPRTSIFGGWKLNQEDSDDPRKRMQQSRGSGGGGGNRRMGGGYPGGGYPGGGGGYGGRRMGSRGESDKERQVELDKKPHLWEPGESDPFHYTAEDGGKARRGCPAPGRA